MSNNQLLTIEPKDLRFIFESKKQTSCSLYLTNETDNNVAFKVKTTYTEAYCVRPNIGVILGRSTCKVLVTRASQKVAPSDMQRDENFLIQSVTAGPGVTANELTPQMFNKELGHLVEETKLKVTIVGMSNNELLTIEPKNLQFIFESNKQITCSLYLTNETENNVAFKVMTTNTKNYCVRPKTGVILGRSTCKVLVTMQAQKEAPSDMQCKDKFLIQSVTAGPGVTANELTREMFNKKLGHLVVETKLRVTYVNSTWTYITRTQGS